MNLKQGCYLVSFKPSRAESASQPQTYVGTLRVVAVEKLGALRASGDLYRLSEKARDVIAVQNQWKATPTRPGEKIPVFPLSDYAYYLDVLAVETAGGHPTLELRARKFDPITRKLTSGTVCQLVLKPEARTGEWTGTLVGAGEDRGEFYLRWISKELRRAQLRIFRIQSNEKNPIREPKPKKPTPRLDWEALFRKIGWQLDVNCDERSGKDLAMNDVPSWTPYDLSVAASKLRTDVDPDRSWTYDLLCVSRFENNRYLGIMFDTEAADLNQRPRETAAVAALQSITVGGKSTLSQDAFDGRLYFRTALHEVGHAMNLAHNLSGKTLMNTTEFLLSVLPAGSKADKNQDRGFANKFNPDWAFDGADRSWLQHAPDIAVRPGGVSRHNVRWRGDGRQQVITLSFYEPPALTLEVQPVVEEFPLGAPVRLDYVLSNHGPSLAVPADISLRGGHISGRVTGPDRTTRYFRSAFRCCDSIAHERRLHALATKPLSDGMTLLRGVDGPLFPEAGSYEIELELRWDANGQTNRVVGRTTTVVGPADLKKDPTQVDVAELLLHQPSMMPALVQGLLDQDGLRALSFALNSPVLAPHYLATALKCKIMGTQRGEVWRELSGRVSSNGDGKTKGVVSVAPPSGSPTAREANSLVGVPIVYTRRERRQLESRPDRDKILLKNENEAPVLAPQTCQWLFKIQEITCRSVSKPEVGKAEGPSAMSHNRNLSSVFASGEKYGKKPKRPLPRGNSPAIPKKKA